MADAPDKPFRDALGELMFRLHMGAGSQRPIDAWAQYGEPVIVPKAEAIKEAVPTEVKEGIIAETISDPTNKDSVQKSLTIASLAPRREALFVNSKVNSPNTVKETYAKALSYLMESTLAQPTHLQKANPTMKCAGNCGFKHYQSDLQLSKSGPSKGQLICPQCAGKKSVVGDLMTPAGDESAKKAGVDISPSITPSVDLGKVKNS